MVKLVKLFSTLCVCGALLLSNSVLHTNLVHAQPYLVFNAKNGKVIAARHPDMLWYPASLTKLMTAYLTFEALKQGKLSLNSRLTCSGKAHKQPPSRIGVPIGGQITVKTALKSIVVKSANDVTVMLAEQISGTEEAFVEHMNGTARRLKMTRTHFTNTNGLPDKRQVTTARDVAILSRAILTEYPQHSHYFKLQNAKIGKKRYKSHNTFLQSFNGANGMKTGFICDSGYNIVASAKRNDVQLVAVVFGGRTAKERNRKTADLLDNGFYTYLWKSIFGSKNLHSLPRESSAGKGPKSMRRHVKVWSCGYRKRRENTTSKVKSSKKSGWKVTTKKP